MAADIRNNLLRSLRSINCQSIGRLFEISKLACEHLLVHVVAFAGTEPFAKEFERTFQIDYLYIGIDLKNVAVALLEGGAGQGDIPFLSIPATDGFAKRLQPGHAIGVVQRDAVRHFFNVGSGMKIVSVGKLPVKLGGEEFANRGFTGSSRAHDDEDHGRGTGTRSALAEEFAEQHVKVVDAVFALHGIAATVIGRGTQAALDVFAEKYVFLLDFVAKSHGAANAVLAFLR